MPLSVNTCEAEAHVPPSAMFQPGSLGISGRQKWGSRELWLYGCERLLSSEFWYTTSGNGGWLYGGLAVARAAS